MASLQVLRLENNRIDALPDNIGSCKTLVKLDLSTNNLHSLPDSMGQFRKLQRLNVANNMLRRVPASMGGLKTLKELDLRCCVRAVAMKTAALATFTAWCILLCWRVPAKKLSQSKAWHMCALVMTSFCHHVLPSHAGMTTCCCWWQTVSTRCYDWQSASYVRPEVWHMHQHMPSYSSG